MRGSFFVRSRSTGLVAAGPFASPEEVMQVESGEGLALCDAELTLVRIQNGEVTHQQESLFQRVTPAECANEWRIRNLIPAAMDFSYMAGQKGYEEFSRRMNLLGLLYLMYGTSAVHTRLPYDYREGLWYGFFYLFRSDRSESAHPRAPRLLDGTRQLFWAGEHDAIQVYYSIFREYGLPLSGDYYYVCHDPACTGHQIVTRSGLCRICGKTQMHWRYVT